MAIKHGKRGRSIVPYIAFVLSLKPTIVNGAKPAAVPAPVRTNWLGNDGNWSPVSLMVGTPPQWIDVFVSTKSQETWVVGSGGCDGTALCRNKRGGLFQPNESSTWEGLGFYDLGLDPQLGFDGVGSYGLETVGFTEDISLSSQILGVINTTDYWAGYLGLGVQPTNFTDANQPTFLISMVQNESLIPSHSYGYTAGAYYRLKSVPASLTLGGYDANRFHPHNISFDLDPGQNPVVAINEISVTAVPLATSNVSTDWPSDSVKLLDSESDGLYTIDSSTPYLWLPAEVCLQFEKALGLTYDERIELYTFAGNPAQHEILMNWNMTFNFVFADLPGSSKVVSVTLPYAAFDLQLTYPFSGVNLTQGSAPANYFPLRKAANSTQYTLGRAFLQETYLTVDYERNNFSISQAIFNPNAINNKALIDISRPKNSTFQGPAVSGGVVLSKPVIAGIVAGAVLLFTIIVSLATACMWRRRKSKLGATENHDTTGMKLHDGRKHGFWRHLFALSGSDQPFEVDGCSRQPNEASSESEIKELPVEVCSELPGSTVEIPPHERTRRKLTINIVDAIGYDPKRPVELHNECNPTERFPLDDKSQGQGHAVSPPYSPDYVGTQTTHATEISSRSPGINSNSSQLSSPAIISPLTPDFAKRAGWMGYANHLRNYNDGSEADARAEKTSQGTTVESASEEENGAQYRDHHTPERHKFSWEEPR